MNKTTTLHATDQPVLLRAGPLTMRFEPGSGKLRCVARAGVELVRGVYATVRDRNWGTIEPVIENLIMDVCQDRFTITFDALHQQDPIDLRWLGRIVGQPDGTIRYMFDGEVHSAFKRNRIGFCVLHPITCSGQCCRVEHVNGQEAEGRFPKDISPHQPFMELRTIRHAYAPGQWVSVRMEGDTFEMEDQRNWTDASFKTYGTPLAKPFPVQVQPGDRINQQVTIALEGAATDVVSPVAASTAKADVVVRISIGDRRTPIPRLGLEATPGHRHTDAELAVLRRLSPDHLRVSVRGTEPGWFDAANVGIEAAAALGCGVEIALFVRDEQDLIATDDWLNQTQLRLNRILLFHSEYTTTPGPLIIMARRCLARHLARSDLAVGTDAFFAEFNRERPDPALMDAVDAVTYSINPQVHACDEDSLVESLEAQAHTVHSAKAIAPAKRICVSPVTLKMRWNPNATAAPSLPVPGELPPAADPRQLTEFAAVWTLGSLKHLAQAGAFSVTMHQTVGYLGVMECETGSPLRDRWAAAAGELYPLGHALADLRDRSHAQVAHCTSSQPLVADALVLDRDGQLEIQLLNLTARPQRVHVNQGRPLELLPFERRAVFTDPGPPISGRCGKGGPCESVDVGQ